MHAFRALVHATRDGFDQARLRLRSAIVSFGLILLATQGQGCAPNVGEARRSEGGIQQAATYQPACDLSGKWNVYFETFSTVVPVTLEQNGTRLVSKYDARHRDYSVGQPFFVGTVAERQSRDPEESHIGKIGIWYGDTQGFVEAPDARIYDRCSFIVVRQSNGGSASLVRNSTDKGLSKPTRQETLNRPLCDLTGKWDAYFENRGMTFPVTIEHKGSQITSKWDASPTKNIPSGYPYIRGTITDDRIADLHVWYGPIRTWVVSPPAEIFGDCNMIRLRQADGSPARLTRTPNLVVP